MRRDVVAAKAGRARGWLNDGAPVLLGPLSAFLADRAIRDVSIFYLFLVAVTSAARC